MPADDEWNQDDRGWMRPVDYQRAYCAWAAYMTGDIETRDAQCALAVEDGRFPQYLAVLDLLSTTEGEDEEVQAALTNPDDVLRMAAGFAMEQWRHDLRVKVHGPGQGD